MNGSIEAWALLQSLQSQFDSLGGSEVRKRGPLDDGPKHLRKLGGLSWEGIGKST